METPEHDDIHADEEPDAAAEGAEPGFGEQDEVAKEQEWAEDAEEGGASEH